METCSETFSLEHGGGSAASNNPRNAPERKQKKNLNMLLKNTIATRNKNKKLIKKSLIRASDFLRLRRKER